MNFLLPLPLNRYQPFKQRFLVPWLLTCVLIAVITVLRDRSSKPEDGLLIFLAVAVPLSIGVWLGYTFDFFGARTGFLKGWFWYFYPLIWWLPLGQFILNIFLAFGSGTGQGLYAEPNDQKIRLNKVKNTTLEEFSAVFAPEVSAMKSRLEAGQLNSEQAEVVAMLTKTSNNPNASIAELLSTGSSNDAAILTDLLFELLGTRRKI